MAIIIVGKTACTICNLVLDEVEPWVAFPHFIVDETHPLWRFSDSGVHRSCFASWPNASEFRKLFNATWPQLVPNVPREMLEDGLIVNVISE